MGGGGYVAEYMKFLNKMWKLKGPFTGVIKRKSCGISMSLGYRTWNFQGVYITQVLEIPGVKLHLVQNFLG